MSKTAYTKYFNNQISHFSFLSENYKINMNKKIYTLKQFDEKILLHKEILINYFKVNNIKMKIKIQDLSDEYFFKAIFLIV
jgi:hypothetical protein